jgi:broad specificity phosphatase PhoE
MGALSGQPRLEAWAGYREEMTRWMAGDLEFARPGGESYAEVRDRVLPALRDLLERHPGGTVVVVAHGVVIRVLLTSLPGGLDPRHFDQIPIEFTALNDLLWDGSQVRIVALNRAPEPDPEEAP